VPQRAPPPKQSAHLFVLLKNLAPAAHVCGRHHAPHQRTKGHEAPVIVAPHAAVDDVALADGVCCFGQRTQSLQGQQQ